MGYNQLVNIYNTEFLIDSSLEEALNTQLGCSTMELLSRPVLTTTR